MGIRKMVTYATWSDDDEDHQDPKMDRTQGDISWEAYFFNAPLMVGSASDLLGHIPSHIDKLFMKKIF